MKCFQCSTRLIYGDGALDALRKLGAERVLMVTDPYFEKNGLAAQLGARTGAKQVEIFSGLTPDPTAEQAAQGYALARQLQPQALLALGGGSPIDCAKAILLLLEPRPTFVAIPTTSGTGSEVTSLSILTHAGVKHPLVDPALRPDWAILDGSLLRSLPPGLIAAAGFDILSHALEAVAAANASPFSDALAIAAFDRTLALLPRSFRGEQAVREEIHLAAAMAGLAFEHAGLGLCHALSHALGGLLHLPHGLLNAVLLPAVLRFNAPAAQPTYTRLARQCGLGAGSGPQALRALTQALCRLRRQLALPADLCAAGAQPAVLAREAEALVQAALADPCMKTTPISPTPAELRAILQEAAGCRI